MTRLMTMLAALMLAACATREPFVTVSPDTRPPCRPAASLMVEPGLLPAVEPGANMFRTLASWAVVYGALRRLTIDLQTFITAECQ